VKENSIPVADQLMPGRVIDGGVSLGKLPNVAFNAGVSWGVHLVDGAVLLTIRVGQAQLDGHGLQGAIVLQEQKGPAGIDEVALQPVDAVKVRHEMIMVVQDEELVVLQCLHRVCYDN